MKKILAIIYRCTNGNTQFLALRNNPINPIHGGDYYYVVTGSLLENENVLSALRREIEEETGIVSINKIIDLNIVYNYKCSGEGENLCEESAYIVEVDDNVRYLNVEHVSFAWLNKEDFVKTIKWQNKKELKNILKNIK